MKILRNPLGCPLTLPVIAHCHLKLEDFPSFWQGDAGLTSRGRSSRTVTRLIRHFREHRPEQVQSLVHDRRNEIVALDVQIYLLPGRPLTIVVAAVVVEVRFRPWRAPE